MPQFDWLCDVCGCVMSPTSGIYWVELGFINNCKESQLWLVLLRYIADVASAFPWVVTYCDAPIWLIVWCVWMCDESHIGYLLGWTGFINNYKEPQLWLVLLRYSADVASAFPWVVTYCDTPIWWIVWCVWICNESHIGYLLGRSGLY